MPSSKHVMLQNSQVLVHLLTILGCAWMLLAVLPGSILPATVTVMIRQTMKNFSENLKALRMAGEQPATGVLFV